MAARDLNALLQSEMPLAFEEYKAGPQRVGLVIVDEVNGFATVGAGNLVSLHHCVSWLCISFTCKKILPVC